MVTSNVGWVPPAADVVAPRQAASKAATPSENPPEKTVVQVKEAEAAVLKERGHDEAAQQAARSERDRRYELQDRVFVYSVSDAKTGVKVVQFPSEQAVKLRTYLAAEAAKTQRKQESQKEHLDIVA